MSGRSAFEEKGRPLVISHGWEVDVEIDFRGAVIEGNEECYRGKIAANSKVVDSLFALFLLSLTGFCS